MNDYTDVAGTLLSEQEIAEKYDIFEDDVIEELLNQNIERCTLCGWWCHSYQLVDDEDDTKTGICEECREDL